MWSASMPNEGLRKGTPETLTRKIPMGRKSWLTSSLKKIKMIQLYKICFVGDVIHLKKCSLSNLAHVFAAVFPCF